MGAGTGTPVTASVNGNYITDLDVDNWAVGATDLEKETTIDYVEQLIEKVTKDYFYEADFDITLDGNGKDRLFLGLMPDIIGITSVSISGNALSTDAYTFDKNFIYIDNASVLDAEAIWLKSQSSGLFPKGIGNINVVGTYGWETYPKAIKQAAIILVRRENDETLYTTYTLGSESIGDYSYSNPGRILTGVREADRLLRPYVRKKIMMAVV